MATSRAADDKLNGKLMVTGRSINHALNERVIVLVSGNAPSRLPAETELRISFHRRLRLPLLDQKISWT